MAKKEFARNRSVFIPGIFVESADKPSLKPIVRLASEFSSWHVVGGAVDVELRCSAELILLKSRCTIGWKGDLWHIRLCKGEKSTPCRGRLPAGAASGRP